jgi:hypothetical protein
MNKLEKIDQQEQKTREKIAAMQALLRQIDGQRTEQENLQIIQQVRALKLSREELYAFINGGDIPASLAGAITAPAEPETIYTRRDRTRRHEQNAETSDDNADATNFESEDITHEDN